MRLLCGLLVTGAMCFFDLFDYLAYLALMTLSGTANFPKCSFGRFFYV